MSTFLLLPICLSALVGVILLVWSLIDHIKGKDEYHEERLPLIHAVSIGTLCITAILTVITCFSDNQQAILFHLAQNMPVMLKIDDLGKFFALTVTLIWVPVGIYSTAYLKHEGNEKRFLGFYLLLYSVLLGINFSGNLVTMYFFYELMTLVSFPMVLHNGSREAIMASLKYLFYSMCGAYMGLFGIFFLNRYLDNLSFQAGGHMTNAILERNPQLILIAIFVMILGFSVKAGMFPLHAWLPTAHPVAPSPASAVLSGIIVKCGVLAIIRVIFYIVGPTILVGTWVNTALLTLSLITVFMGSLLAFREPVFKKRLAYSTVSQVSYVLFGLFVLTPEGFSGALQQVLFHAVVKCGLFLVAGVFLYKYNITRVDDLVGIGGKMPLTLWCYTFFALSLIGIPPTAGFISKWHLAQGALDSSAGPFRFLGPAVLLVSALLTAGYLLPITTKGFFPGKSEATPKRDEPPLRMLIPLIFLAALALLFGLFPGFVIDFAKQLTSSLW